MSENKGRLFFNTRSVGIVRKDAMSENKIRVLVVPVNKAPEVRHIDGKLETMQALVGG